MKAKENKEAMAAAQVKAIGKVSSDGLYEGWCEEAIAQYRLYVIEALDDAAGDVLRLAEYAIVHLDAAELILHHEVQDHIPSIDNHLALVRRFLRNLPVDRISHLVKQLNEIGGADNV